MASNTGTLQWGHDLHGETITQRSLRCLFPKSLEQCSQNSRCGHLIFESNIDQLEKRGALRQRCTSVQFDYVLRDKRIQGRIIYGAKALERLLGKDWLEIRLRAQVIRIRRR
jgi:hypothetical protein